MTKFRLSESKAKQAWTLPNVRNFDRRSKSRLLLLLVLLLTAVTGAWAQTETYTVKLKDGTVDAEKWSFDPTEATTTGVAVGQTVTLTYNGDREVKSVTAKVVKPAPVGAIKGKFTVNADGKQVYFAKGNLQAVCTSADNNNATRETFTWQFAENQWDCVGNNAANNSIDGNGSVSAAGTVDLFGWSTAATTYGIHNSTTSGNYSGAFVDWGGTIGPGWRTLSNEEWNYLFFTRTSGSKVNGIDPSPDNARYTHAIINTDNGTDGIKGMILFPDGVTVNNSDASWGKINERRTWGGATKCTMSQWNALAAKGFVFLPAAGYRNGTTVGNTNQSGYYWSSTLYSDGQSYYIRVLGSTDDDILWNSARYYGSSVRLVYDVEYDPLATPLTIEALTAGSINVANPKIGMQYSLDGGATKTAVTTDEIVSIDVAAGDKVQFYGDGTNITCYGFSSWDGCTMIKGSGEGFTCKVYGNIMSLLDEENFATATMLSDIYTFKSLFLQNLTLTDASGLLLPATQLAESCYHQMFFGCSALTAAPALPATQLQESCYEQMFSGCSALAAAPALPAETLAYGCYQQMFISCSALTAAPVLPATTLVSYCYNRMFNNCSKLATVTCLATSGFNQTECTSLWLNGAGSGVQGTKTFNAVSTDNWPSGDNGIPDGWTSVNIGN